MLAHKDSYISIQQHPTIFGLIQI